MRKKKVEWFRSEYEKSVAGTNARPSIISHSFGTYIIAEALVRYPEITLDRLILCGSIVRRDFDWRRLLDGGQVNAVLNEYGGRDIWAKLVQWFVADTGPSGTKGFTSSDSSLYQRYRPHFGHSDYFFPLNYQTNWIPFLRGHEPEANAVEEGATPK